MYGDLLTIRGCIQTYGGPIEQRLISKNGYPNSEMRPFDFHTALENAAFKCDDVATETLLNELVSGKALEEKREESFIVIEMVHKELLEDCQVNPSSGSFGEVLFLLDKSLKSLRT